MNIKCAIHAFHNFNPAHICTCWFIWMKISPLNVIFHLRSELKKKTVLMISLDICARMNVCDWGFELLLKLCEGEKLKWISKAHWHRKKGFYWIGKWIWAGDGKFLYIFRLVDLFNYFFFSTCKSVWVQSIYLVTWWQWLYLREMRVVYLH